VSVARLVKDPSTQRPKGFGFVTYESEEEAQKALKAMNGRVSSFSLFVIELND
jgi:cold-inducible RNA-binding protein